MQRRIKQKQREMRFYYKSVLAEKESTPKQTETGSDLKLLMCFSSIYLAFFYICFVVYLKVYVAPVSLCETWETYTGK